MKLNSCFSGEVLAKRVKKAILTVFTGQFSFIVYTKI
jgi:hypothetical protein